MAFLVPDLLDVFKPGALTFKAISLKQTMRLVSLRMGNIQFSSSF